MRNDHKLEGIEKTTKSSGALLLLSGIIFFIFNTVSEALYPSYNLKTNALSDLGAIGAPTRYLWDGQLLVSSILGLFGMYLLFYRSDWGKRVPRRKLTGVLYILPAVGSIIVSLFPENSILALHTLGAFITFVLGGISAIYAYRLTRSPFRYFSIGLGIITLGSTFLLGDSAALGFGLVERLVVFPFVIWTIAFGSYLISR